LIILSGHFRVIKSHPPPELPNHPPSTLQPFNTHSPVPVCLPSHVTCCLGVTLCPLPSLSASLSSTVSDPTFDGDHAGAAFCAWLSSVPYSLVLLQMAGVPSFLTLNSTPLCKAPRFLISSSAAEHLGCFCILATVKRCSNHGRAVSL
jgi:hypothetical protein